MNRLVSQIAEADKLDVELIEFEYCVPPGAVFDLLKLKAGQEVQRVIRVRRSKRRPIMHLTTYVPAAIGRSYSHKDLARKPLYQLLVEHNRTEEHWHCDETRWLVFVKRADKAGFAWTLWVFAAKQSIVFVLDPTR